MAIFHEFAHEIILACYLLCQAKDQYQIPVCLLVPQGTAKGTSRSHAIFLPRDRNGNPDVDPYMYIWNRFLEVFCYE